MGTTSSKLSTTSTSEKPTPRTATKAVSRPTCQPAPADIPPHSLLSWSSAFSSSPINILASTLLTKSDLSSSLVKRHVVSRDGMVFNLEVETKTGPVTNQKSSGRCWLFATCNVIRTGLIKKFDLGDFELSQSYLFFYDSLEKANYFLEQMIDLSSSPLNSRLVTHLCTTPENDGGQWDMVVNLVEKYGLVPKAVYPESYHSSNTSRLDGFLTSKLRDFALELRAIISEVKETAGKEGVDEGEAKRMAEGKAREAKEGMMEQVYRILAITLGAPPSASSPFTWEYMDKYGRAHSLTTTPLEFYHTHCAPFHASNYISLINDPRHAYNALYTVERLGNVWEGREVRYVNTTMDEIKATIVKMLKADQPVWFGCDVGKMSNSQLGIMDADLMAYESAFGTSVGMSKAERLEMGDSAMTHAMVIPAAQVDENGKIVRCKVENSWSDTAGDHGYFLMTDKWMDEYLFQIVIPKSMAPKRLREVYEKGEATVLPVWDPMGSLA